MAMSVSSKYIIEGASGRWRFRAITIRPMAMIINGAEIKRLRLLICFAPKAQAAPFRKLAATELVTAILISQHQMAFK